MNILSNEQSSLTQLWPKPHTSPRKLFGSAGFSWVVRVEGGRSGPLDSPANAAPTSDNDRTTSAHSPDNLDAFRIRFYDPGHSHKLSIALQLPAPSYQSSCSWNHSEYLLCTPVFHLTLILSRLQGLLWSSWHWDKFAVYYIPVNHLQILLNDWLQFCQRETGLL